MKKLFIILFLTVVVSYTYGQTTYYVCRMPRGGISTNQNRICSDTMTINNNFAITNNATVRLIAKEIIINPGFSSEFGTDVSIEAMATPALRSDKETYEEKGYIDSATAIDTPEATPTIRSLKIYTITGQLVYSSETHMDLYSVGLSPSVYIIQKEMDNGEIQREKIILNQ